MCCFTHRSAFAILLLGTTTTSRGIKATSSLEPGFLVAAARSTVVPCDCPHASRRIRIDAVRDPS